MVEDMHGLQDQAVGGLNRRPSGRRMGQAALDGTLDALERVDQAPMTAPF